MKLKERRIALGYTAMDVADQVGYTKPQMSYVENFVLIPTPSDMQIICNFLKCKVYDIYSAKELEFIKQQNKAQGRVELLFGEQIRKVQFRLNFVSYNLLELAQKTLGCTDKHDLYRKIIEPYIMKRIKREQQKRINQKQNIINLTREKEQSVCN